MLEVYAGNEYPLLSRIILCFMSVNQCSCPSLAHRDSAVTDRLLHKDDQGHQKATLRALGAIRRALLRTWSSE